MPPVTPTPEDPLQSLRRLYADIDCDTARLERLHAERLHCGRGCAACCVDDLTVGAAEAEHIRRSFPDLLDEGTPHPRGACAFLDESGACRIYAHRPYVCRTQGLPLRWIEQVDGHLVEHRDICPLNEAGAPITALPESQCWTIGPVEQRLAALNGERPRVRLRDLFAHGTHDHEPEELP